MAPCYVVFEDLNPGIYFTWHECSIQVLGVTNSRYKKYPNYEQALQAYNASLKAQLLHKLLLFLLTVLLLAFLKLMIASEIGRMCKFWLLCCWLSLFA
jgi:hypothetical protein